MSKSREMDMTEGSILKKMIIYALPLLATNVLQLLFNAADVAVLGRFVGKDAVAAVGSTGALINLIIGLFVGLSVGANVMIARFVGQNNIESARRTIGMSIVISLVMGTILLFIGFFCSHTFLEWMKCDEAVIGMATKYMRIYFLGMPIMLLYNFCASILRAVGDTLRPFIFLVIAGVINVILNLIFVRVFNKDVEGVAIATVVSQGISALCCIFVLIKGKGFAKLEKKYLRIYVEELKEMIRIGLPSGLQGCVFSISNVMIQSSVNSFGKITMAAFSVAGQIDGFIYQSMYAVSLSAVAFVSQNYGAGKIDRVKRAVKDSLLLVSGVGIVVGGLAVVFRVPLCNIITKDSEVIELACRRLIIIGLTYSLCGIQEVFGSSIRGLGNSILPMIISLTGCCVFRIIYLKTVFVWYHTFNMLCWLYTISWLITVIGYLCVWFPILKKAEKKLLLKKDYN